MKYVVSWMLRPGGSPAEQEAAEERLLDVFSKWTQPEEATFHQFLSRVDMRGGFAVVETDDLRLVADGPAKFAPWFDFEVTPVMDIADLMPIAREAIDFRSSIS